MHKHNCHIGFNDRWQMLVGIPLLSFIVPIVFMNCRFNRPPYLSWEKYLVTLGITTSIWLGNRYVMIYSRKKYPLFQDVRKRLIFQSLIMLVVTITLNILLGFLADDVFKKDRGGLTFTDVMIHSNAAALFCTIMIIAIYESVFFMHQLKNSSWQ